MLIPNMYKQLERFVKFNNENPLVTLFYFEPIQAVFGDYLKSKREIIARTYGFG